MPDKGLIEIYDKLKQLRDFTLHVRNCHELGPHRLRMEGVQMTDLVDELIKDVANVLENDAG